MKWPGDVEWIYAGRWGWVEMIWWPTSWNVGMGLGGNSSQFILTIECWGRLTLVLDLTAPADVARANEEQP
jgi:hypothetical protein